MDNEQTVRINFEVSRDLHAKMARTFPYGMRGRVVTVLLEAIVEATEKQGQMILGAILDGQFVLRYQPKGESNGPNSASGQRRTGT